MRTLADMTESSLSPKPSPNSIITAHQILKAANATTPGCAPDENDMDTLKAWSITIDHYPTITPEHWVKAAQAWAKKPITEWKMTPKDVIDNIVRNLL